MLEALMKREEVQLPWGWWLDLSFRDGVEKRVGWWVEFEECKKIQYLILFRDGTRSPLSWGAVEEKEK